MNKLILYPIIAVIIVLLFVGLFYFLPALSIILLYIFGAVIFSAFILGIINIFKYDLSKSPKLFLIKKGNHYSNLFCFRPRFFKKDFKLERQIMISRSVAYKDDECINKLFGITFGLNPLKNSVRFGFKRIETASGIDIKIVGYCHTDGNTIVGLNECNIEIDKYSTYTINIHSNKAMLYCNKIFLGTFDIHRKLFGYLNKPYNGGKNVAIRDLLFYEKK
jgi:hypothetical protein